MQQITNDYINWLRQQEGLLAIEEAQLHAEEQWLLQKERELEQQKAATITLVLLQAIAKVRKPTPYERQKNWLRRKRGVIENKRVTLQARRAWIQSQKSMYGIP